MHFFLQGGMHLVNIIFRNFLKKISSRFVFFFLLFNTWYSVMDFCFLASFGIQNK